MIDMVLHIDDANSNINIKVSAEETNEFEIIMAIAGVIDSLEIYKEHGTLGTAEFLGKALMAAELMNKHSDLVNREKYEEFAN